MMSSYCWILKLFQVQGRYSMELRKRTVTQYRRFTFLLFSGCLWLIAPVGCDSKSGTDTAPAANMTTKTPSESKSDSHGHSHAHSHDHGDHGEHGGHLVHLSPSGAHAEWAHDDETGTLTVYLEEIVSGGAKVERVQVELEVSGNPKKTYDLESGKDDHNIENSVFTIKSAELLTALEMPEGVKAKLIVVVDGAEQSCMLEHSHDDHGHNH